MKGKCLKMSCYQRTYRNMPNNADPIVQTEAAVFVPGLGDEAPDFTAMTTDGVKSLSDFRGRWVILFSHPGDFTPV